MWQVRSWYSLSTSTCPATLSTLSLSTVRPCISRWRKPHLQSADASDTRREKSFVLEREWWEHLFSSKEKQDLYHLYCNVLLLLTIGDKFIEKPGGGISLLTKKTQKNPKGFLWRHLNRSASSRINEPTACKRGLVNYGFTECCRPMTDKMIFIKCLYLL